MKLRLFKIFQIGFTNPNKRKRFKKLGIKFLTHQKTIHSQKIQTQMKIKEPTLVQLVKMFSMSRLSTHNRQRPGKRTKGR
jgi:hypothetical protein